MGIILDTSILIESDRRGGGIDEIFQRARQRHGEIEIAISAISIVELTHGVFRGTSPTGRENRRIFLGNVIRTMNVYPMTLEIAQLAGRIEGEQAASGFAIPFEDLIIGTTALYLGFDVATTYVRHFKLIPDLTIIALWCDLMAWPQWPPSPANNPSAHTVSRSHRHTAPPPSSAQASRPQTGRSR